MCPPLWVSLEIGFCLFFGGGGVVVVVVVVVLVTI
jgi:hypothetical protein